MTVSPIKQQTVVAQVMDEIRKLITSGEYVSGDKIPTELELAKRFGIGRSSIREAIKIFNYLGVLDSRAALGTFVKERSNISSEALTWSLLLGNDEFEEIIDLRGSIELWCLIKLVDAYRRGDEWVKAVIAELRGIVVEMKKASAEDRREDLIEEDFRFHQAIIASSGNPLFLSTYETLRSFLFGEIKKSQDDYKDASGIYREHRQLLEAFSGGRRVDAVTAYMGHIENIKKRLRKPH